MWRARDVQIEKAPAKTTHPVTCHVRPLPKTPKIAGAWPTDSFWLNVQLRTFLQFLASG